MTTNIKLTDGMIATVRTGKAGESGICWSDPFAAELIIEKDRKGVLCGLSLKGINFAEFDPRYHSEAKNVFMAEDYALEILSESVSNPEKPSQPVRTITLPEQYWDDIVSLVGRGLDDLNNYSPNELDGYSDVELDDQQRLLKQEASQALATALNQKNA